MKLILDSETTIRVSFTLKDGYTGGLTARIGDSEENVAELQSNGTYVVLIRNISSHLLGTKYNITATTDSGSATTTVSALSYARIILNSGAYAQNTNALNAMAAIYRFYLATVAYRE